MCYNCPGCVPCPPPCNNCIEPETVVVKLVPKVDPCDEYQDIIDDALANPVPDPCEIAINSISVIGSTVQVFASGSELELEYSDDNITYQSGSLFPDQGCGIKKYFVRIKSYPDCLAAKYATVSTDCECIPLDTPILVQPLESRCWENEVEILMTDGCGNDIWEGTGQACGECTPDWQDVSPPDPRCIDGVIKFLQSDGCGHTRYRETVTTCDNCIEPSGPDTATVTAATCAGPTIQANGSIVSGPFANTTKYGISLGSVYSGPNYAGAQNIPVNNIVSVTNLQGKNVNHVYTLRLFNGSDSCKTDIHIPVSAVICAPSCISPTGTLYKVDPTCTGNVPSPNGMLKYVGHANTTGFQVCEDSTFSCTPNYDTATPIVGTGEVTIRSGIAFAQSQPFKDFVVRFYNGSADCFIDTPFTFSNPCYSGSIPGCTEPTHNTPVITQATCSGSTVNNNASIAIAGILNGTKYGYSAGTSYEGPVFASAMTISGGAINITGLAGSANDTNYTIRFFNASSTCFIDVHIVVPGKTCAIACVTPTSNAGTGTPATCTGATPNSDAIVNITGITNMTKYGVSNGGTYSGPNFASAISAGGSVINLPGLAGSNSGQQKTIRIFNGSDDCKLDVVVNIAASGCVGCVEPTFSSKSGTPATCAGATPNNDASIQILGITSMTKYGVANGPTYSGGPNYAGAISASPGTLNITGIAGSNSLQTKTIRVFNGGDACYLDITQTIAASSCVESCTEPTFAISTTPPTTCDGENSSADGVVTIHTIANGNKWQICIDFAGDEEEFTCTPNYAGAVSFSGAGPVNVSTTFAFTGQESVRVWVRVYNGNGACFRDHFVDFVNPCVSCCGMTINSATVTNT